MDMFGSIWRDIVLCKLHLKFLNCSESLVEMKFNLVELVYCKSNIYLILWAYYVVVVVVVVVVVKTFWIFSFFVELTVI